jgi:small subunit ribosomal protein S20
LANHKSAEKRARQNMKRRMRNKPVRAQLKHATKEVRSAAGSASKEAAMGEVKTAQSVIDKAAKKGVIHRRTAARKISRLSKLANSAGA